MGLFKDMPATDKMKLKTTLPWVEIKNHLNGKSEKELLFHSDKKDMMNNRLRIFKNWNGANICKKKEMNI